MEEKKSQSPSDVYWASLPDSKACASEAVVRIRRHREALRVSGLAERMRRSLSAWLGYGPRGDVDSSRASAGGESGETLELNVNQYAAMVTQAVALTTNNKPSVKAIAGNSDFESLGQATFAEALNDYYDRELAVSDREYEATLKMVLFGEGWLLEDWDENAGQPYTSDEKGAVRGGDVRLYACSAFDVAHDPDAQDIESLTWVCWRRRVNKWDLAARFPALKDDILAETLAQQRELGSNTGDDWDLPGFRRHESADSDCVWLWELRHVPTPALPHGRLLRFLNDSVVLTDTVRVVPAHAEVVIRMSADGPVEGEEFVPESVEVLPYPYADELYAFSAAPERIPGSSFGHTAFFDLLSLQEGIDLSATIMASAINAGGMQNLYVPRGANITVKKLTGALNVIEFDGPTLPEAKENVALSPHVAAFAQSMLDWAQRRVSLNEVVTGNPSAGMPAQAMALLRAQAVEFHSRLQSAYERLVQRGRTGILKLLQQYADTERVALVAGKANSWALREFKKKDVAGFDRFVVEPVNPALKTLAGKVSFAEPLLKGGAITPQQYLQLFTTGRLEPVLKFPADNQARIEREKELLLQGIGLPPPRLDPLTGQPAVDPMSGIPIFEDDGQLYIRPLISDTFWVAIPEYLSVLSMPEVRQNVRVVDAVLGLVDYCMKLWKVQPPAMTAVLRGVPFPEPMGPGSPTPPAPPMGTVGDESPGESADVPEGAPPTKMPVPPRLKVGDDNLRATAEANAPPQ